MVEPRKYELLKTPVTIVDDGENEGIRYIRESVHDAEVEALRQENDRLRDYQDRLIAPKPQFTAMASEVLADRIVTQDEWDALHDEIEWLMLAQKVCEKWRVCSSARHRPRRTRQAW